MSDATKVETKAEAKAEAKAKAKGTAATLRRRDDRLNARARERVRGHAYRVFCAAHDPHDARYTSGRPSIDRCPLCYSAELFAELVSVTSSRAVSACVDHVEREKFVAELARLVRFEAAFRAAWGDACPAHVVEAVCPDSCEWGIALALRKST